MSAEAKVTVGVNGIGQIGSDFVRYAAENIGSGLEVRAVNDNLDNPVGVADLIGNSMLYGSWKDHTIVAEGGCLVIDGTQRIRFFAIPDPSKIPWQEVPIDIIIESEGVHNDPRVAAGHLRKPKPNTVIISSPPKEVGCPILVFGVNETDYNPKKDNVVSAGTGSTNCLTAVVSVLDREFALDGLIASMIHADASENDVDASAVGGGKAKLPVRNIVPWETDAARTLFQVMPHLEVKMGGTVNISSHRVSITAGSVFDINAIVRQKGLTAKAVMEAFQSAAGEGRLKDIIGFTEREITAIHSVGTSYAALVSASNIKAQTCRDGSLISMSVGYDPVRGFNAQMSRLARSIWERGQ